MFRLREWESGGGRCEGRISIREDKDLHELYSDIGYS